MNTARRPDAVRIHVETLQRDMRHALSEFRKHDAAWNELNDAFLAKIREENRRRVSSGRFPHTPLSVAQQKGDWLELSDAMSAAQWWRDKAQCLGTVILAEQAAREMLREM